jgi:hypothetical protein
MQRSHYILNAASNLLGITLLIIAGLHITNRSEKTFADEIAWIGAICFSLSCVLSYLAIRSDNASSRSETIADILFLIGLLAVVGSVAVVALSHVV